MPSITQSKTNRFSDLIADHRGLIGGIATAGVVLAIVGVYVFSWGADGEPPTPPEKVFNAKVKRAISAHTIKLKSDERLNYAGIRGPYKDEPLFEEALRRNKSLVEGRRIRMRYDKEPKDGKDRVRAYVFADEGFVNEILVREGLAYVRLTPGERRFATELLAAQAEARRNRRGIWKQKPVSTEPRYPADPKYGNFHRPSCEEVAKIKPERLVTHKTSRRATDAGCAPCPKCRP